MGTTLTNGIYLPNEGEKNCYAGLKINWETLDQKIADITALQQAVAGALHREIVESLPTTDIEPNTIYMILSGTSATENVYNEFMYVNNAWELIGTSATDLTNYYTKAEVDGKLLLKANASDLTSHTGDTTIHVTASDKTKWTNSANTHVLRLAKSALTPSTSDNSFSNLDDSTTLKVGDKVMDTAGVLFEVTAIDTQNSTFTIGTALIDLAQDSDVVHKSGDETIGGLKTFENNTMVVGRSTDNGSAIQLINSDVVGDSANGASSFEVYGSSISDANKIGSITIGEFSNNGGSYATIESNRTVSGVKSSNVIRSLIRPNGSKEFSATVDNDCKLGTEFLRWSKIYGTEYYYGSNNVEFSTKFVTTDTAQTISGAKTFSDTLTIYNNDSSQATKNLTISSSKIQVGDTSNSDSFGINFNAGLSYVARLTAFKDTSGTQNLQLGVRTKDSSNNLITSMIRLRLFATGNSSFESDTDNLVSLGSSSNKWSNVQTYKVNGLEPSSLGMPDLDNGIDISSYITLNSDSSYTPLSNGYVYICCYASSACGLWVRDTNNNGVSTRSIGSVPTYNNLVSICIPAVKNVSLSIFTPGCENILIAKFYPCQGNV